MSTSTYTSFAVAGTGRFSSALTKQLASNPAVSVRVLSRSSDAKVPPGVKLSIVDYDSPASLESALEGVQVVVSGLSGAGIPAQAPLAKAAKKQGVQLFLPSEYGNDTSNVTTGPLAGKYNIRELLKEIGLPYVSVFNGLWTDVCFAPFIGFDFANGKATIVGKGDTPISFTTSTDSARFIAHIITTLPPSSPYLNNANLRIQGDLKSFNDIFRIYEEGHPGTTISVTHEDLGKVKERIGPNPGPAQFLDLLKVLCEEGSSDLGKTGELSNGLWKEWNPTTAKDYFKTV